MLYVFRLLVITNTLTKHEAATVVSSMPDLKMNDEFKDQNRLLDNDLHATTTSFNQTTNNAGINFKTFFHY